MFTFKNSVTINPPVAEVFRFVSGLERIPEWNYYVKRCPGALRGR
jgi:uncharacterized membrane protein